MGQRVNLQYSVDIDALPSEVNRLLQNAFIKLEELTKTTVIENVLSVAAIEKIDEIRLTLSDVDYLLNDVHNIVSGYIAYKTQKQTNASEIAPEAITELQKQIADFRNEVTD